tara:strand:+ start:713 stop:970 length:258 start_codon:yes stop_codon:yes gene_type:complete
MAYNPTTNLIEAARKVSEELSSDEPLTVDRIMRRRRILASVLNVHARNLENEQKLKVSFRASLAEDRTYALVDESGRDEDERWEA